MHIAFQFLASKGMVVFPDDGGGGHFARLHYIDSKGNDEQTHDDAVPDICKA
jgi:hypothetical protein